MRNKSGKVALRLTVDFNGSDGMSDHAYPYSGQVDGIQRGCGSNHYDSHYPLKL